MIKLSEAQRWELRRMIIMTRHLPEHDSPDGDFCCQRYIDWADKIIEYMSTALPQCAAGPWQPITDDLPNLRERVLFLTPTGTVLFGHCEEPWVNIYGEGYCQRSDLTHFAHLNTEVPTK